MEEIRNHIENNFSFVLRIRQLIGPCKKAVEDAELVISN